MTGCGVGVEGEGDWLWGGGWRERVTGCGCLGRTVAKGGVGGGGVERGKGLVCCLVALRPSKMLVYLRDGSAQTNLCAATLR